MERDWFCFDISLPELTSVVESFFFSLSCSCLHFSRQKRLLETQNVEFNSFRTIKISDLELLSQSHLDFFGRQREQREFLQL